MIRIVLPQWISTPAPEQDFQGVAPNLPEVSLQIDGEELRDLVRQARAAAAAAHAPHSQFHVGAVAVMADDPSARRFVGANIENSSLGLTVCAERSALQSAASAGHRSLRFLAVSCANAPAASLADRTPCGACRQVIREFATPQSLILVDRGEVGFSAHVFDIERLLPFGFRFNR